MVGLTDRPDMTLGVYRGREKTTQQEEENLGTVYSQCIFDFETRNKQMFIEARAFSRVTYFFLFSSESAGFFLKLT